MFLSIKEMELRKVRFDETFPPGEVDFSGSDVRQTGQLHVKGLAELLEHTGGEVRIRGNFEVDMEAECDRCLGVARFPLRSGFDLFYRPMSDIAREEEVSIDEGEAEIGFYEDGGMQLEDIMREQIMLQLPMQKVCNEACQGICPVCGKNRNESSCQCQEKPADDRWQALRNM